MPDETGKVTGEDEDILAVRGILFGNLKRTFDEYQQAGLAGIHAAQAIANKQLTDAQEDTNAIRAASNLALQNAVETANLVGKQAVRHADLAVDRQWNIDEVAVLVARSGVFRDAVAAAVAGAVNDALAAKS